MNPLLNNLSENGGVIKRLIILWPDNDESGLVPGTNRRKCTVNALSSDACRFLDRVTDTMGKILWGKIAQ